jgi:hypothetical protein
MVPAHRDERDTRKVGALMWRNTGQLRRTEIWFHTIDGQVYITGPP